jgi:hypothetical protein
MLACQELEEKKGAWKINKLSTRELFKHYVFLKITCFASFISFVEK